MSATLTLGVSLLGFVLALIGVSFMFFGETYPFALTERFHIAALMAFNTFALYLTFQSSVWGFLMAGQWWLLIPVILGLLAFTRFTSLRLLARYPVAILAGLGLGLVVGLNIRAAIVNMITQTVSDLSGARIGVLGGWVGFICAFTVIPYFLYSTRYSKPFYEKGKVPYYVIRAGRLIMLYVFGEQIGVYSAATHVTNIMVVVIKRTIQLVAAQFGIVIP
jgi:hypothetical protein